MKARYPDGTVDRCGERLHWLGQVTPTEYSATYDLVLDHQIGMPVLAYVSRPRLQLVGSQALPHVYSMNTLCLFVGNREWNESRPVAGLIPWVSEWLLYYELWLATGGEWLGGGVHPLPRPVSRRTQRESHKDLVARRTRLMSALRHLYGRHADIDELLFNSRL